MKKLILLLIIAGLTSTIQAQVEVDQTMTPEELVEQVLLGEGVDVFNVQFNGFAGTETNNQIARYIGPSNFVDFDEGVVMVSGNTAQVTMNGVVDPETPVGGDEDLHALANTGGTNYDINDQAVLEFDFIPEGDSLTIRYVFTSQEYPSWTCSSFNDPFGFFLSGPGIEGTFSNDAINIAVVPGTTDIPIAVNSINSGVPANDPDCLNVNPNYMEDSQYFVSNDPSQAGDIQFPGMTVTLTARAAVQCGEIYHIKLAISDANDDFLDSGVFLEKGGFQAESNVSVDASPVNNGIQVGGNDFTAGVLAGCTNASFCMSRDDTLGIDTSYFSIVGSAIPGVQYIMPEEEYVIFPEGEDTICFEIETLINDLGAQVDSIGFEVFVIDQCTGDSVFASASIAVYNEYSFDIETEDVTITCPSEFVELEADGLNGISPYTYEWALESDPDSVIGQGSSVLVEPPGSGLAETYIVTVYDDCDITSESTLVTLFDNTAIPVEVSTSPADTINCVGQTVELTAFGQNGQGSLEYSWTTGDDTPTATAAPDGSQTVTYYTVFVSDSCGVTASDSVAVYFIPLENPIANAGEDVTVTCAGDEVPINASASNGAPPYQYTWSNNLGNGPSHTVSPDVTTTYYLTVTDDCQGTSETDSIVVTVPVYDPINIELPSPTSVCPEDVHLLTADVSGGAGEYSYDWSTGSGNSSITVAPSDFGPTDFEVTVTDQCNDSTTQSTFVLVPVYDPIVPEPASRPSCTGESFTLSVNSISGGAGETLSDFYYLWVGPEEQPIDSSDISSTGTLTIQNAVPGVYSLFVVDACGNTGEAVVDANLLGIEFIPNVISPNNDDKNDYFIVPGSSTFDTKVTIMDRWGKVAFESDQYVCDREVLDDPGTLINQNCWQGGDDKGDVYYYMIDVDNGACGFEGTVHVLDNN